MSGTPKPPLSPTDIFMQLVDSAVKKMDISKSYPDYQPPENLTVENIEQQDDGTWVTKTTKLPLPDSSKSK